MPPDAFSEFINGFTFILLVILGAIVAFYFINEWRQVGWNLKILRTDGTGSITIAIFAIVCGNAGDRLVYWMVRHAENHGENLDWFSPWSVVATSIFTALLAIGAACAIRVMGPERCGNWLWQVAIVGAFTIAAYMTL